MITEEEQGILRDSTVAIIGCGGLGNTVAMELASIGVGSFIIADGDSASESNLNRQFLYFGHLGQYKVDAMGDWLVDAGAVVAKHRCMIDETNVDSIIERADVVADCLDDSNARRMLAQSCRRMGKVLVHGGVEDSFGQVGVFAPDSGIHLECLLRESAGLRSSYAPAVSIIGSLEADETVKVLLKRDDALFDAILTFDMGSHRLDIHRLNGI